MHRMGLLKYPVCFWADPFITETYDALFVEWICMETEGYALLLPSAARWLAAVCIHTSSGSSQLLEPKATV